MTSVPASSDSTDLPPDGEELRLLLDTIPRRIGDTVHAAGTEGLLEIVLDLGRVPSARYADHEIDLGEQEVTEQDLDQVVSRVSEFGEDNRAGIPRTLHRISAIRNRRGRIVGLTCRVGRAVSGSAEAIRELLESGQSVLLLGRPGVGKTTMLREAARVLADELGRRVVIVDTSNEIGGDGDIPHRGIGRARRMQVRTPELQHHVMIEAVENHMPQVIVIDEIGTALEAVAARTIAERGVQLVGTAHGNTLANLMQNPTLSDLIGGIESVTLSDEEARRRGTQKTVLERRAPPTFDAVVEMQAHNRVAVHEDIAATIDALLRGFDTEAELRIVGAGGELEGVERITVSPRQDEPRYERLDRAAEHDDFNTAHPARAAHTAIPRAPGGPQKRLFPFGISRSRLEEAIALTRSQATVVDTVRDADIVLTLRPYYRRRAGPLREAETRGVPIYVLRNNTVSQMEESLLRLRGQDGVDPTTEALREAEEAISSLAARGGVVELTPQSAYIRRLQHEMAQRHGVRSASRGREPFRRVTMLSEQAHTDADLPWWSESAAER